MSFDAKLVKIKSKIWSEPLPTPIIEGGTLMNFDILMSLSTPPRGYSLTSEFFCIRNYNHFETVLGLHNFHLNQVLKHHQIFQVF